MLYQLLTLSILSILSLGATEVEVRPLNGPTQAGQLESLTAEALTLLAAPAAENSQVIPAESLLHVRPSQSAKPSATKATIWLRLIDGSQLQATAYEVKSSSANVTLLSGDSVTIPTRAIDWVRFKSQSPELAEAWEQLTKQAGEGDRLVVRRSVDQAESEGAPARKVESLDFLSGVLFDITSESLTFEFNGQSLDVGRAKAEGLIYHHAAGRELSAPLCLVETVNGDSWQARAVTSSGERIALTSVAGVKHELPLDQAKLLDFSAGKIVYLSDIEPESTSWKSFFGGANELPSLQQLFAPRQDQNFDGEPLKLGGQTYEKGLALHSHSDVVYRLPGSFRKLAAVAGIDDSLGDNGHVVLRIYGDKELLLEESVAGSAAKPLAIELDMQGVRKLRIEVDFGENLDIADHLNLGDIRVMK